ncbi:alkaline phosphatase [bacterium]|nr:alkaline phosphatase [bacterium]
MKSILIILISFIICLQVQAQSFSKNNSQRPKLVVGIVIDQMRYDYLYRFNKNYGKGGFNRLMNDGTNFTFAHFNYSPTNTAPGHASIFTGTTPFYHGIIGNDWYDRFAKKMIYSMNDTSVRSIGSNDKEGQMSPRRLLATTMTDQLKLATNNEAKVISISLKNRGAILPGGHTADAAYWYDNLTGDFISSSYYMETLPVWVVKFNERKLADHFMSNGWKLSLPESRYLLASNTESNYEKDVFKESKNSFPHYFNNLKEKEKYDVFETTAFGNTIVAEFAKEVLLNEKLGKGKETDFFTISFSSTDHVAHDYGTFSLEVEDTYIKLDSLLADLLNMLDKQVGKGNYLLFLTSDHAGIETPSYLRDQRLPTGELNNKRFLDSLKLFCINEYGDESLIENLSNRQIFLNRELIKKNKWDIHKIERAIADYIRNTFPVVTSIFTRDDFEKDVATREPINTILNGFNPVISGDIAFNLQPGYLSNFLEQGSTHSTSYSYDTHVPMLFYGWRIPNQTLNTPVFIVDIAATISNLLGITEPSASIGIPLIK